MGHVEVPERSVHYQGHTDPVVRHESKDDLSKTLDDENASYDGPTSHRESIPNHVLHMLTEMGLVMGTNGEVDWNMDGQAHPRKWPLLRRSYDTAVLCFMEFFMTLVSSAGSTIAPTAATDFGVSRTLAVFCLTTLYLIGQAFGNLFFAPLAESFGSRPIYMISTLGFAVCCAIIGAWPIVPVVAVFRTLSGFLASIPVVVAAGSIEDMWPTKTRVWTLHGWVASSVMGLAVSPVIATAVLESPLGWQVLAT
ncbi:putative major facilitator superfamily, MFS transporter superfamily [Septoria linicola]|nr:putative major facilitator superfamily, MFS transporter superfamily [Septoria linicola]